MATLFYVVIKAYGGNIYDNTQWKGGNKVLNWFSVNETRLW